MMYYVIHEYSGDICDFPTYYVVKAKSEDYEEAKATMYEIATRYRDNDMDLWCRGDFKEYPDEGFRHTVEGVMISTMRPPTCSQIGELDVFYVSERIPESKGTEDEPRGRIVKIDIGD